MPPVVVLVDDDDAFRYLVAYALRRSGLKASLQCVSDGEDAIHYLSRQGKFADDVSFPLPSVVLLDLKMPRITGFEVLEWRLKHPEFQQLPFVVLTSSDLERDRKRAAELRANSYFVKPMDAGGLVEILNSIIPGLRGD